MACVEAKLNSSAPVDQVWNVISDYGNVHFYHPMVKSTPILTDNTKGVGAKRRCEFYNKSSIVEEVTNWDEGRSISVALSEMTSMPLKKANATFRVTPIDTGTSEVSIDMNFSVKWGPLGWMMGKLMIKPMMKKMFKKVLKGIDYYVVTGNPVEKVVPEM